jgi:DMSO/TMAO reductase YedYZ molybdopterin-dependent catalytic subunit
MSSIQRAADATPPNQKFIGQFIHYAAMGVPEVDLKTYRLKVTGLVERRQEYSYDELVKLPQLRVEKPFWCVTGWSVAGTVWEGPSLRRLLSSAEAKEGAGWVMFKCMDGYDAPVPFEDAMAEDSLVALKLNGQTLSREMGFPARPFIPHLYGWKSAKWLTEIQVLSDYVDGYWEMRGYHERGNVWEEERFKSWGRHQRRRLVRPNL